MKNLEDYALIGDCNAVALVHNQGSIDWCCMPIFDSPAIFSALLGDKKAGYFSISPVGNFSSAQQYVSRTNVVETQFKTTLGEATLLDGFCVFTEDEKKKSLHPDCELLRIVKCNRGRIQMRMEYFPTIFYGKKRVRFRGKKKFGFKFSWKTHIYILQSNLEYDRFHTPKSKERTAIEFTLAEGEEVVFSLSYSCQNPAIIPEVKTTAAKRLNRAIRYWRDWIAHCNYSGWYKDEVERSVLAIKLLVHAPSGAIVAAPTTSLPEWIGGSRNWDYRYCWLRDASFTVRALLKLGYMEETHAFMNWILHATKLTFPRLQVVYTVFGESKIPEKTLHWLQGYKNSKPVRIGNEAFSQFQLDVYGEVLDAFFSYSKLIENFDNESRQFIIKLAKRITKIWDRPDEGIWEGRAKRQHHTHSKVMAWVGLDRVIKLIEKYNWKKAPVDDFVNVRDKIRRDIEENGFNPKVQSYTKVYGETDLDASLLTLSLQGYCDVNSTRMRSTINKIGEELSENDFIMRYRSGDGLDGKEGSFTICTFWYIENLARRGEVEKAKQCFEAVVRCAGPTGLLSEEIDPEKRAMLGNFPQAFSHIGLINAAYAFKEKTNINTS